MEVTVINKMLAKSKVIFLAKSLKELLYYILSDRESLAHNVALETMETDLSIALKCQLILSHGDGTIMFAKAVEVLSDLRRITTLYLDDILNSQVEIDSGTPGDTCS